MKIKLAINRWTCRLALAGVSLMGLPLFAQEAENLDEGEVTPAPVEQSTNVSPLLPITVSSGVSEQFNTDIKSGGSFSITRFKAGVVVPVRLGDKFVLSSSVKYGLDSYTFDGIPSTWNNTWHNIDTLSVASILTWRLDDTWTVYGGGLLRWSAESGAAWGDAAIGGGLAGFNYKVDDDLSLGAGLAVVGQIEDDNSVVPLITARWKFADNWRLDAGLTDVATYGYGVKVNWLFNKEFEFGFGAQVHKSRFRLATNDGVGQEESGTIYADCTWHWCPNVDFNGFFGIATGGQLRVDDSHGRELRSSEYDPAPVLGVAASVKF